MVRKRARPRALPRSKYPMPAVAVIGEGDVATRENAAAPALQTNGGEPDPTAQRVVRDSFTMPLADYALIMEKVVLDLERLEGNLFRGFSPAHSPTRVFGGQVAGQALVEHPGVAKIAFMRLRLAVPRW